MRNDEIVEPDSRAKVMEPDLSSGAKKLAWLMDESVRLPGGLRIGLDGIIGLIPGVGDVAGAAVSSYIVYDAQRKGVPVSVLLRMILNIVLEAVIGSIPVLGDLFDFVFKANLRNIALLENYQARPRPTVRSSWFNLAGYGLLIVLVPVLLLVLLVYLVVGLISLLS